MRTALIMLTSVALFAACIVLFRRFFPVPADAPLRATQAFIAIWFCVTAVNLWFGVTHAGYTLAEELPVFALLFCVPVAGAILAKWRSL